MRKGQSGHFKKDRPVLIKRRKCQNIIEDGLHSGIEKRCNRPVKHPNHYLCDRCIRCAESLGQCLGTEE
jgi:hypothetical protein